MTARTLDIAVYGIINAGKSSLINALAGRPERPASPIGGTTVDIGIVEWRVVASACLPLPPGEGLGEGQGNTAGVQRLDLHPTGDATAFTPGPSPGGRGEENREHYSIRLLDTPGLEEVGDHARGPLATEAARRSDLVLFVLAEDLTSTARRALLDLKEAGKPIVVALNKMDLLGPDEQAEVARAVRDGLAGVIATEDIVPIAASPIIRRLVFLPEGGTRVETIRGEPEVGALEARLLEVLAGSAEDLKALAEASSLVESHVLIRETDRSKRRAKAERVADETSAALAVALAVNPVPLLDFLTGPGGLVILVRRVAEVYGEKISGEVARGLAGELIRGGRVVLWGSLATTIGGGAMKILPGIGHLAGALTQGASAGYFGHIVGRALVEYLDRGHDWGDGGLVAALDRIAASTDRKAVTRGLVDRIKARLRGQPRP